MDDSFVFVNENPNSLNNVQTQSGSIQPIPPELKSMHVASNVRNRYAHTEVTSKYFNPDNKAQQTTFAIVLPDSAFIAGFIMEIKGKRYEAYVKEKEAAKHEYQQAVSQGIAAAHVAVSARDSNNFTVSVNVEPESDVTFILTYEELLVRKRSKYEMVINLNPGQFIDDLGIDIYINETRPVINVETPALRSGNEITNKITKNEYASIKYEENGVVHISFHPTIEEQKKISTEQTNQDISRQFVIQYDVERDPKGGEVLINDGYFVHFFAPSELKSIPKNVIFVLDVSGSMHGRKIEQLKEAMFAILNELKPEDYFNIVKFSNNVQVLYNNNASHSENTNLPATTENIRKAQQIVSSMQADGGTNICDALITALSLTLKGVSTLDDKKHKPQPMIVFLTDGQANVGQSIPEQIINIIEQRNDNKTAIFTLAFGNDANKEFLKELAVKNSGFLRNIYEAADASLQLQDFYKQISSPLLTNITFKYSDHVKNLTKHNFDILFDGSEFVVTGTIDHNVDGFVVVEGSTLYGINDFVPTIIPICTKKKEKEYGHLERLWAYMTIKQLLDKKYEKLEVSNTINTETPEKQALKLALKYSFVTPVSSLVVVKPEEKNDDLQWGSVQVGPSNFLSGGVFPPGICGFPQGQLSNCLNKVSSRRLSSMSVKSFPSNFFGSAAGAAVGQQQSFGTPSRGSLKSFSFSGPPQLQQMSSLFGAPSNANLFSSTAAASLPPQCFNMSAPSNLHQLNVTSQSTGAALNLCTDRKNEEPQFSLFCKPPKPQLVHTKIITTVQNNYAQTVITKRFSNKYSSALETMFSILVPDSAVITELIIEIDGQQHKGEKREKLQAENDYNLAVSEHFTGVRVSSSPENNRKIIVNIQMRSDCDMDIILIYKEYLKKKNEKYEIIYNLFSEYIIEDLNIDININNSVVYIDTPFIKTIYGIMKCLHVTIKKNNDNTVNVSFSPKKELTNQIYNMLTEPRQFVVEFKTDFDSEENKPVPVTPLDLDLVALNFD